MSDLAPLSNGPAPLGNPPQRRLAQSLRDFTQAVRHIHDLNTFLEIFQVGLERAGLCAEADLRIYVGQVDEDAFMPGRISLPISTDDRAVTVAQVAPPDKQHFGPEDLQVLAGLSGLLGAAVDVAHRLQRDERSIAALKALLSFAPVGICAFDLEGRVQAINSLARGWLALAEGDKVANALPAGISFADLRNGVSFHLRLAGRLLFCEARPQADGRFGALVVVDLTPEQGRLLDSLTREVYRGNHLRRPVHFLLLERAEPMGALLAAMPGMRTTMGRTAIVGPYDAARVGVIFPESSWTTVVLHLRRVADRLDPSQVKVGRATLQQFNETPERMIENALTMPDTLAAVIRPRILVHDEYRAVGDSLRLIFGKDCEVTGSTSLEEANRLIQEQHFDAVLADLSSGTGGQELVAFAKARNQAIRAFYLSSELPGGMRSRAAGTGDIPVFSKPFDVEIVRDQILGALANHEPPSEK